MQFIITDTDIITWGIVFALGVAFGLGEGNVLRGADRLLFRPAEKDYTDTAAGSDDEGENSDGSCDSNCDSNSDEDDGDGSGEEEADDGTDVESETEGEGDVAKDPPHIVDTVPEQAAAAPTAQAAPDKEKQVRRWTWIGGN